MEDNLNIRPEQQPGGVKTGIFRLFRHSAIYTISTSVQRLQGLIMTPIYTSLIYLPEMSQYSNYGLVYTFIAFMNFAYMYGMDSAFMRFYFLGKASRRSVFSNTFFTLLGSGLLTSVIIILFAKPLSSIILFNSSLAPLLKLAALILFFDTLGNLPFLLLRVEERPVSFTLFRMLRFGIELSLNILFVVVLKKAVLGILYANIIASVINLLVMLPFTFKYIHFSINLKLLKEMVFFGLPFLPNGIAFMAIEMADRFLVTKYLGKDTMAFYHANYKFAAILLLLIVGFRNAWQPFFLKIAGKPDARSIYSSVLRYYLFAAGTVIIFITFFMEDILTYYYFDTFFILGTNYWEGIKVIPWIVLSYFFFGIYIIFTPAFYITKKSKYMIIFTSAGAALNLTINFIFLPKIGLWSAVLATVCAYALMTLLIVYFAQKIYPIPLNLKKIIGLLTIIGMGYFLYYIIAPGLMIRFVLYILILVLMLLFIFLKGETAQVKSMIFGALDRRRKD